MKNVIVKHSDLFSTQAEAIVLPADTNGNVAPDLKDKLWEEFKFTILDRRPPAELGHFEKTRCGHDARAKHKRQWLDIIIVTLTDAETGKSDLQVLRSLLQKIADYSNETPDVKGIAIPLLGTGKAKLNAETVCQLMTVYLSENGRADCLFELHVPEGNIYRQLFDRCTHRYHSSDEKACPYPAIYRQIQVAGKAVEFPAKYKKFDFTLVHDEEGACLFHSQNHEFKKENRMVDQFRLLVPVMHWARKQKALKFDQYDFEDFLFVGQQDYFNNEALAEDDNEIINLSEITFPDYVTFKNCRFLDLVWISYCKFLKKTTFEQAKFISFSDFSNTAFSAQVEFSRAEFRQSAGFTDTTFNSSVQFEDCKMTGFTSFNNTQFKSYLSFERAKLQNLTLIKCMISRDVNDSMVNFKEMQVSDTLRMEKVEFNGEVDFKKAKLHIAELVDVQFSPDRLTSFDQVEIKGNMVIKSLDAKKKIFNHLVSFETNAELLKGEIVFENCNVYFIRQLDDLKKLALPSVRKITFGQGCDKYKLRKEFHVPMKEEWQFLIQEMADSFVAFFNWNNTFPVAINMECDYFQDHVLVRYFADADLEQPGFEKILYERVPVFLKFLKDPQGFMKDYLNRTQKTISHKTLPNDIDIYRKINSVRTGIAARITLDPQWDVQQTLDLLKALSETPNINIAIEFNNIVINQKDIFSFGTKKFISSGDINYKSE